MFEIASSWIHIANRLAANSEKITLTPVGTIFEQIAFAIEIRNRKMGLGGLTRDSIVGLNKLVHDDDDEPLRRGPNRRLSGDTSGLSGSWNNGSDKGSNEFLFLEGDGGEEHAMGTQQDGTFETSLNDGSSVASAASASTPRSSAAVAAATSYNKVSATNSRSLDSYRPSQASESSSPDGKTAYMAAAQVAHYQGFQYEGYTDYYSEDYASYNYDDYSDNGSRASGGENKNIFCCLFAPWQQPKAIESDDKSDASISSLQQEAAAAATETEASELPTSSPTPSLKEKFPNTNSLGSGTMPTPPITPNTINSEEYPNLLPSAQTPSVKFTTSNKDEGGQEGDDKPTMPHMLSGSPDSSCFDEKKQEEGDHLHDHSVGSTNEEPCIEVEEEGPPPIKGILKVRRCSTISSNNSSNKTSTIKKDKDAQPSSSPKHRHLFPQYEAKKSSSDGANGGEKKKINFNPMARVLTIPSRKDIPLHQKAQVWWQRCDYDEFKKTGRIISKAMECGGSEIWLASSNAWGNRAAKQSSSSSPNKTNLERKSSDEAYNKALSKYVTDEKKEDNGGDDEAEVVGNKWWCKFGHSRRGLEHIASSSEGKARQSSVLMAIRMVMEEQKRQRASRTKDPNKLRNVAMQYTSWARDLALAAGAADAEAVASGFDPTAASRAHHFAKRISVNDAVGGGVAMAVTSQILDANTHATPRTQARSKKVMEHSSPSEDSLSKRAKGFIPGGEGVSAAAVLSGSGYRSTVKA